MNPRTRRARGGLSERAIKSVPLSALHPLPSRQAEVLGWIAAGKRNGEIATILTISERTVEKHVEKIFAALQWKRAPRRPPGGTSSGSSSSALARETAGKPSLQGFAAS